MKPIVLLLVLLAAAFAGCSEDAEGPTDLQECPDAVNLSVASGTEPTFSWEPRCRLFFLIVEPAESGEDLWSVMTLGVNAIEPPVEYGVIPAGATELVAATQLVAGSGYKVAVWRHVGGDEDDGEMVAVQTFTP